MGVVLLMFSLGLEFNLRKLTRVGMSAFVAALLEITLMIWFGYELGRAFGWSVMDSVSSARCSRSPRPRSSSRR